MAQPAYQALQLVAEHQATHCFHKEWATDENYRDRQLDGLGMALSNFTGGNGFEIMQICAAALEDANFHAEAAKIRKMIKR